MISRRGFLGGSVALLAAPLAAEAQQANVYRVGILSPAAAPAPSVGAVANLVPLALRERGYAEGQNLVIERRFAEGKLNRLPRLVRELLQLRVDVIVAVGGTAIQAAKDATGTIPIVMGFGTDPVERGFARSLARPGGNITGVVLVPEGQLVSKRLELIKEAVPRAARLAILSTGEETSRTQVEEAKKAASSLGITLTVVEVQGADYEHAFAKIVAEQAGALFVLSSAILHRDRDQIIPLAAKRRLPAIYEWREQAEAGGLMSYGSSLVELSQRVAVSVDRILKGAKPADLPIEQPTKFELVINLKTAKALGITIPPSLLLRADQVIE
jgi:putative ABC transport system substrate-binding protein